MTPTERRIKNTPLSIAMIACRQRNHDQQFGVAIEAGNATLMRIDREGKKTTQIPVAGPVKALDQKAVIAMVDDYIDMSYFIRTSDAAMQSVRSVLDHAGIDYTDMTPDGMINASRPLSARCHHSWDRPYRGHGVRKCLDCGGLQSN